MTAATALPGLYYTAIRPPPEASPLRTDVAGFCGRTLRGPVGRAVRVVGWREAQSIFGAPADQAMMPYALRGYFENGGQVAHIVRLLHADTQTPSMDSQTASATWNVGTFDATSGKLDPDWAGDAGFQNIQFKVEASSPGDWANDISVTVRYWARGSGGGPELELQITPRYEGGELITGIHPGQVAEEVETRSTYVRLTALDLPPGLSPSSLSSSAAGPRYREWPPLRLTGGTSIPPTKDDYLGGVEELGDQPEVALVSCPDLYPDLPNSDERNDVLQRLLTQADDLHDRLVLIDVPRPADEPTAARDWVNTNLREALKDEKLLRNGAVYYPRLLVRNGSTVTGALRCVPCCGLVAGVISRLDRQLGPYSTPANAVIDEAFDLSQPLDEDDQSLLYAAGINVLKCFPNRGVLVWGGRVLGLQAPGTPLAHRRLIHVLVRAIHRVAEPLVFDTNGPELWLAFTRAITSVLLQAFRAGALKGARPDEAFRVVCDASNNSLEQVDQGLVRCDIDVAPAYPMEFIHLRVAVSGEGKLEVFES